MHLRNSGISECRKASTGNRNLVLLSLPAEKPMEKDGATVPAVTASTTDVISIAEDRAFQDHHFLDIRPIPLLETGPYPFIHRAVKAAT